MQLAAASLGISLIEMPVKAVFVMRRSRDGAFSLEDGIEKRVPVRGLAAPLSLSLCLSEPSPWSLELGAGSRTRTGFWKRSTVSRTPAAGLREVHQTFCIV